MYLQLSAAMWSHYSQHSDECNRLFARRAHLSVLPPSWGRRGTGLSCGPPLVLRMSLAMSVRWSTQRWGCGPRPS